MTETDTSSASEPSSDTQPDTSAAERGDPIDTSSPTSSSPTSPSPTSPSPTPRTARPPLPPPEPYAAPVELPSGHVPCQVCGVAVSRTVPPNGGSAPPRIRRVTIARAGVTIPEDPIELRVDPSAPDQLALAALRRFEATYFVEVEVTSCSRCAAREASARTLLRNAPAGRRLLAHRGVLAIADAEMTLAALSVIRKESEVVTVHGKGSPTPDLGSDTPAARERCDALLRAVESIGPATAGLSWLTSSAAQPGRCNVKAFDHVGESARSLIRAGYGAALKLRTLMRAEPHEVAPPLGLGDGCGWCGVSHVSLSALEVHRRGGPALAASSVWAAHHDRRADFALCPSCQRAYASVGAVGPAAVGRAFLVALRAQHEAVSVRHASAHAGSSVGSAGAARLVLWPGHELGAVPPAWMTTGLQPVRVGWSWTPTPIRDAALRALRLPRPVGRLDAPTG